MKNIDQTRCDYLAGGYVTPKVSELKASGRWDNLSPDKQNWYENRERGIQAYKQAHPELALKAQRMLRTMRGTKNLNFEGTKNGD